VQLRILQCTLAAALLVAASGSHAQPATTELGSSLKGVLAFLEGRNPELRAMNYEADAAQQRLRGAGALPDPVLQMELRDIPFSDPTLSPAASPSTLATSSVRSPAISTVPPPLRTSRRRPGTRFTSPMKSATMRLCGWA